MNEKISNIKGMTGVTDSKHYFGNQENVKTFWAILKDKGVLRDIEKHLTLDENESANLLRATDIIAHPKNPSIGILTLQPEYYTTTPENFKVVGQPLKLAININTRQVVGIYAQTQNQKRPKDNLDLRKEVLKDTFVKNSLYGISSIKPFESYANSSNNAYESEFKDPFEEIRPSVDSYLSYLHGKKSNAQIFATTGLPAAVRTPLNQSEWQTYRDHSYNRIMETKSNADFQESAKKSGLFQI